MSRRGVGALGGLVVLVLAAGAYMAPSGLDEILPDSAPSRGGPQTSAAQDEDVDVDALAGASSDLDTLTIAELGHGDDYDRDLFGQRWADIDRNGCDQRNDALRAGAVDVTTKPGTHGCVVLEATIQDLSNQMLAAASELKFELAGRLRDEVQDLKKELRAMEKAGHA